MKGYSCRVCNTTKNSCIWTTTNWCKSYTKPTSRKYFCTGTTFIINSFTVDASSADLSDLPGAILRNGQFVEVKGTLSGNTIDATRVEL